MDTQAGPCPTHALAEAGPETPSRAGLTLTWLPRLAR